MSKKARGPPVPPTVRTHGKVLKIGTFRRGTLGGELMEGTMVLELQRAYSPDEMGEQPCILCEQPFEVQSVRIANLDGQSACPSCLEHFGRRNAKSFPTIEEYEAALSVTRSRYGPVMRSSSARISTTSGRNQRVA
jgi:hypothetical protein